MITGAHRVIPGPATRNDVVAAAVSSFRDEDFRSTVRWWQRVHLSYRWSRPAPIIQSIHPERSGHASPLHFPRASRSIYFDVRWEMLKRRRNFDLECDDLSSLSLVAQAEMLATFGSEWTAWRQAKSEQ